MQRFYLKSFGCKVNQYDGQGLRERLVLEGWEETINVEEADLVALHFCVVTGRAASRCRRSLKSLARRSPGARILVGGCLTPQDHDQVRQAFPEAEFTGLDKAGPWGTVSGLEGHTRAFVKVQDGCNLKCAYCIIPSIRGEERSRPLAEVTREVGRLLEGGRREIVLCGIRLGGYKEDGKGLDHLLESLLADHAGPFRLRLSSLNPAEVTPRLLEVMASDPRVAPHLHLPLQSGDQETLKRMRRPYSAAQYLKKAGALREALDRPAISTDLIVGFPGEDEASFERSLATLEEAGVSRVHVFPYSPREGTEAASLAPVADHVKTGRVQQALERGKGLKAAFDRAFLHDQALVLVETAREKASGLPVGLTARYQKVAISNGAGTMEPNTFVKVQLMEYSDGLFMGRATEEDRNEAQG